MSCATQSATICRPSTDIEAYWSEADNIHDDDCLVALMLVLGTLLVASVDMRWDEMAQYKLNFVISTLKNTNFNVQANFCISKTPPLS